MTGRVRVAKVADLEDTWRLAENLAAVIAAGDVIALSGGLGAGKTSFARHLIRALVGDPDLTVPSPSFPLLQTYETASGLEIWHLDLYRLSAGDDVWALGLADAFAEQTILVVEWPERMRQLLRGTRLLWTRIHLLGETERRFRFTAFHPAWHDRLTGLFSPHMRAALAGARAP